MAVIVVIVAGPWDGGLVSNQSVAVVVVLVAGPWVGGLVSVVDAIVAGPWVCGLVSSQSVAEKDSSGVRTGWLE